ncbi:hypothetical protein KCV03_g44, partial [Aureobasidium melanogenum]
MTDSFAVGRDEINNIGARRSILGSTVSGGRSTSEGDSAKVDQRNKRFLSILDLSKVFDNPLGIGLAESACGFAAKGVADGRAFAVVLDGGYSAGGGCGGYGDGDTVAGREADAAEVVGVVGVPFVPGVITDSQEYPSIPTQAEAEYKVLELPPGGTVTLGMVNVPVTVCQPDPSRTPPAQLLE